MVNDPLVSVRVLAYNHESYIRQCLESILMQKTSFSFEVVIGEDCSTDNTRAIVLDYQKRYPEIINVIISDKNVGMRENSDRVTKACRGKYQATCEGDDYWIDPLKLQKQVDYMEANPDLSMCFHNAFVLWEYERMAPEFFCERNLKELHTTEDLIEGDTYIPTASRLLRSECVKDIPEWTNFFPGRDRVIFLFCSLHGDIGYMKDIMAVYRKHAQGYTEGKNAVRNIHYSTMKQLYDGFNKHTNGKYALSIKKRMRSLTRSKSDFLLKNIFHLPYHLKNFDKTLIKFSQKIQLSRYRKRK